MSKAAVICSIVQSGRKPSAISSTAAIRCEDADAREEASVTAGTPADSRLELTLGGRGGGAAADDGPGNLLLRSAGATEGEGSERVDRCLLQSKTKGSWPKFM